MNGPAQEARALYTAKLKDKLEPHDNGKFLVLNLDTGEYEIDAQDVHATERALARFPGARLFTMRVGGEAAIRIGTTLRGRPPC